MENFPRNFSPLVVSRMGIAYLNDKHSMSKLPNPHTLETKKIYS